MKKKLFGIISLVFIFVLVFAPVLVSAQTSSSVGLGECQSIKTSGLSGIVRCVAGFFNAIIYLLIGAAVVYVVYGAFKMITSEEGRQEGKNIILYGVIGLFVMVSIWGLVNILDRTFNLSRQQPIEAPLFTVPK